MKKIVLIAIIFGIGWYGNLLYKQNRLPFLENFSSGLSHAATKTKCITKDGSVIYGSVPEGTVCERIEPVAGSLTIVDSATYRDNERNSYNQDTGFSSFQCDARVYCSEMRSCEEAIFFLRNCPDVKMDGNSDGIPCEKQWCK
jgi:hypothetical protein